MRTNKFRVWDNEEHLFVKDLSAFNLKSLSSKRKSRYDFMQWTGAPDKNGVDIYEGDIMNSNGNVDDKGIVVYEDGEFHLWSGRGTNLQECYDLPVLSKMFAVIGNIYENPDMIPPKQLAEDLNA